MKIAFIAHRANYLKHYGPVIDEALSRGWQVECWIQQGSSGGKEYLNLQPETLQALWGEKVALRSFGQDEQVLNLQNETKVDALVSLHPRNYYFERTKSDVAFVTLQHSVDTFVWSAPKDLASSDHVCLFTPFWMEYAADYYRLSGIADEAELHSKLDNKVAFTGFAQMDAFKNIDPIAVRQRWGLDAKQPILLLLPIDLTNWSGAWPAFFLAPNRVKQLRKLWQGARSEGWGFAAKYLPWALRGLNDQALTDAIVEFCEKNDALLLVKGREKDPLRPGLMDKAAKSLYDDAHYPPTIFEAIAIADLCMLFYSTAAQEAAYAGVPSLCVDRPNYKMAKHQLWRTKAKGGPYNYPGVVDWMTLPETITKLPDMALASFQLDERARQSYLLKYNGPADHKASQRILDLLN
jgi:hypothetical protein